MKLGKTREELIEVVKLEISNLIKNMSKLNDIVEYLEKRHDIPRSAILDIVNNPNKIDSLNDSELALLASRVVTKEVNLLSNYFTESELSEIRIYKRPKEVIHLSRTFDNVVKVNDKMFIAVVERDIIAKMYDNGWFIWDEKVQREGKKIEYDGSIFSVPSINFYNVKEIEKQVLDGILIENSLVYNLVRDSSEEGQEWYYDNTNKTLTIANDFKGQIVDGMHRTIGIHRAWMKNRNIKGVMPIIFTNYTTKEANRYLYESSKAVPIDKSRIQVMSTERLCDRIVDNLMLEGYLKDKISKTIKPSYKVGEIVSYKTLSDAFYNLFEKEGGVKVSLLTEKFQDYLMYLFDYFADEYLEDKKCILFKNMYFYLHVYIFKKMVENEIPFNKLYNLINPDMFMMDSPTVVEYKISEYREKNIQSPKLGLKFIDETVFNKEVL